MSFYLISSIVIRCKENNTNKTKILETQEKWAIIGDVALVIITAIVAIFIILSHNGCDFGKLNTLSNNSAYVFLGASGGIVIIDCINYMVQKASYKKYLLENKKLIEKEPHEQLALPENAANEKKQQKEPHAQICDKEVEAAAEKFVNRICSVANNDKIHNYDLCRNYLIFKAGKISRAEIKAGQLQRLRTKAKKWAMQSRFLQKGGLKVIWATGTQSPALVGMAQVAKSKLSEVPALVPTGVLAEYNIVPLTGELVMGVLRNFVNTTSLSGAPFDCCHACYDYATRKDFAVNQEAELDMILTTSADQVAVWMLRLKIAILRLIHGGAEPAMLHRAREHIKTNILPKMQPRFQGWETLARFVGIKTSELPLSDKEVAANQHPLARGTLVSVDRSDGSKRAALICRYKDGCYTLSVDHKGSTKFLEPDQINQIRVFDQKSMCCEAEKMPPLSTDALEVIGKRIRGDLEYQEEVKSLLQLFETEKTLQRSQQEQAFIDQPFPIIWGVTSDNKLKFFPVRSAVPEWGYRGVLKLGSDIKVVFTKSSKMGVLKQWLQEQKISNVAVMSLGAMMYLQTQAS